MAGLAFKRAVNMIPALNTKHTNFRRMSTLLKFSCWRLGEWRRADTIGHLGGCRQTAMCGIAAISALTVEYCALPSPTEEATIGFPGSRQPRTNQESAMGEPFPGTPPSVRPLEDRLDSWNEIAASLDRDVTSVQRWEKREGMPVHRHVHDRMGSVYAFSSELDAWVQSRKLRLEDEEKEKERRAELRG